MYKIINLIMLLSMFFVFSGLSDAEAWFWQKAAKVDKAEKEYQRANEKADKAFDELDTEAKKFNEEKAPSVSTDNETGYLNPEEKQFKDMQNIENGSFLEDNIGVEKESPTRTVEKKRPSLCGGDYPIINGLPNWVISPFEEGYSHTAVGLGIYGDGGIVGQMKAARIQALGELSKIISVQIENELLMEKKVKSQNGSESVVSDIKTYSRQRAEEMLPYTEEIKCWVDPATNDYYVLLGIPYDKIENML